MKKKNIAINISGTNGWIGGLYYKINILFSLLQNPDLTDKYDFIVFANKENLEIIKKCFPNVSIVLLDETQRFNEIKFLIALKKNHCEFLFVNKRKYLEFFNINPISWIPDFQHNRLPEMFDVGEIQTRNKLFQGILDSCIPLVLSSKDSLNDLKTFYSIKYQKNIYVVPFVSYIEPFINELTAVREQQILNAYALQNVKYVCVMNQFWKHKNHIVVLKAIKEFYNNEPDSNIKFVFTGKLEDQRNRQYIDELKSIFEEPSVKEHSVLLGFIKREEQIAIMKNAEYIIQPSLFEGWGTVVEDAKVLDKTILLSDIPVHHEQMNNKCILFDPKDSVALAKLIEKENKKEHIDDVGEGISDMYKRAKEYSTGFEQLLRDLERN